MFKTELMIKALLGCAGRRDIRRYLNAVAVDGSGGALQFSASDGHLALIVSFDEAVRYGYFPDIPRGTAALLCRKSLDLAVKTKDASLWVTPGGWRLGPVALDVVDSRAPDIVRVLGLGAGTTPATEKGVDFTLLAPLMKALTDLQKAFGKLPCGISHGRDATSPFTFTGTPTNGVKWEAALMPCRV